MKIKIVDLFWKVEKAVAEAAFKNFSHAAARIRKDAIASITKSSEPSQPGSPPHTRKRQLNRAILFSADKQSAVIGPRHSVVGDAAQAHEFGGSFRGTDYPERPFMGPALDKNAARFGSDWAASVGD